MAPVYFALKKDPSFTVKLVLTGQHTEMLDEALEVFGLRPDYNLNIMLAHQTPTDIMSNAVKKLGVIYEEEKPHLVLVHGDTSTTLAASIAAFYGGIPVCHVEAGLRTGERKEPFPEEMNRILTDRLADILFPPTSHAAENIIKEGLKVPLMTVTGNTIVDAVLLARAKRRALLPRGIRRLAARPFVLFTMHRRESWGAPMESVFFLLKELFRKKGFPGLVFPVHPNPAVKKPALKIFSGCENIVLTKPLRYNELLFLLARCLFVITDSGGIQEEAAVLKKRAVLLRRFTERPEGVAAGFVKITGTNPAKIEKEVLFLLNNPGVLGKMKKIKNPYGDGRAALRIRGALRKYFGLAAGAKIKDFK
ncbi:MAG: UDP-N-acetylglucosamine 2-epimerase (non-hydrolyzing) [Elusimicrobia bacterium CG08_land_8_20_14_0_20_44_26]|nr:MAG: UDP-N-acetylglucosamine 2-epimerase (non-hydrolyzing) [Elusimicrobia bacterium CG08_land_8_20_14_0_20_44_26]